MINQVKLDVMVKVPVLHRPVNEPELMGLCYLKHRRKLALPFEIVIGGKKGPVPSHIRRVLFEVTLLLPYNFGPLDDSDLIAICSLKHEQLLPDTTTISVKGGDFGYIGLVRPDRATWKEKIYYYLKERHPHRVTSTEILSHLGVRSGDKLERSAAANFVRTMAVSRLIRSERQVGSHEWSYWV